jgi:hypothetical protein
VLFSNESMRTIHTNIEHRAARRANVRLERADGNSVHGFAPFPGRLLQSANFAVAGEHSNTCSYHGSLIERAPRRHVWQRDDWW